MSSAGHTIDSSHQLLRGVRAHHWPKTHHCALLLHLQAAKCILRDGIHEIAGKERLHVLLVFPGLQSVNARDELKRWIHTTNCSLIKDALLGLWMQSP